MDLTARPIAQDPYDKLPQVPEFTLVSSDITDGQPMDKTFAADGDNISPQFSWSGFPQETKGFVVSCFDPDAPTPSGFWHWTIVDLDAGTTELEQGWGSSDLDLPGAAFHVRHDMGEHSYMGPLPPEGDRPHKYHFVVHALDTETLELDEDASPTAVAFTLLPHTIARARLIGTYQR